LAKSPADRPQSASEVEAALASVGSSVALAPLAGAAIDASRRRCAQCGALGPPMVRVCFACGRPQLELSAGPMTVFITGPGEQAHKLDAALRQRLLAWISQNPALGVDARVLAKEVPRVPFPLVSGIDEESAHALVPAMCQLGL